MSAIKLDNQSYPGLHVVSLKRNFSVLDGANAGRLMNGKMVRDIIGTYYNYSVEIDSDLSDRAEYDRFYQAITRPVDSHVFEVPYGQTTLRYDAYVTQGSDELLQCYSDGNAWGKLAFNFIAMAPQRVRGT